MPVAERLYLENQKLLQFTATVTDIREYSRRDGVQVWQLALDRTAFYPTSGGQPFDTGTLQAKSRSGAELTVVVDEVVEDDDGEVWHLTKKPLLAGTRIAGEVLLARRLDHTQQHSGQHLLSAILHTVCAAPTVSFHLGELDATIDVAVLSKEAQAEFIAKLPAVEERVNAEIAENPPVHLRSVSHDEAEAMLTDGLLRKLPSRSGSIRLVEIPGLDLNACGGTHVASLGEIGCLLLREVERVKQGLRLHFVCGLRAVRAARADWQGLTAAAAHLSTARSNVYASVERLSEENKALLKERLRLLEDLAESHAVQLAVEERIEDGLRLVCRVYKTRNPDYIKLLAGKLLASVPQTVAILASQTEEPALVLVAANFECSIACNQALANVLSPLGLRAGGTAVLAQAKVPAEHLAEVTGALAALFVRKPEANEAASIPGDQLQ